MAQIPLVTNRQGTGVEQVSEDRFYSKRRNGISPVRKDGSICTAENDVQAAGAEKWAAEQFGAKFNGEIYETHGDGGYDFKLHGQTVDVVWLGFRSAGHLIINPDEPQRWAELYVVVAGVDSKGFTFVGWITHAALKAMPMKDFGYGKKMACHTSSLYPISTLLKEKVSGLFIWDEDAKALPFLRGLDVIIPLCCPKKYRWWQGGQSLKQTEIELQNGTNPPSN